MFPEHGQGVDTPLGLLALQAVAQDRLLSRAGVVKVLPVTLGEKGRLGALLGTLRAELLTFRCMHGDQGGDLPGLGVDLGQQPLDQRDGRGRDRNCEPSSPVEEPDRDRPVSGRRCRLALSRGSSHEQERRCHEDEDHGQATAHV